MPKTLENINKISFLFFAILGTTHILSMLMLANNCLPQAANLLFRTLDLPFLLSTLIYGGSALQLSLRKIGLHGKILSLILIILLSAIFALTLYLNFFFPDL
ncbi:MAG: hypothetical protein ABII07_01085 [Patescibacteria group bacterium]